MTAQHETPFGVLPGAVVVNFAVIDAAAHAWDLSASLGRAIEFPPDTIPLMRDVVALTCNDHTIELGLVKPPTVPPVDATDTERLMAAAGRVITRPEVSVLGGAQRGAFDHVVVLVGRQVVARRRRERDLADRRTDPEHPHPERQVP